MWVVLPAVIVWSRAARDQPGQRIHIVLVELGQRCADRSGGAADSAHAGLDDRHGIAGAAPADDGIGEVKAVEQSVLPPPVAPQMMVLPNGAPSSNGARRRAAEEVAV